MSLSRPAELDRQPNRGTFPPRFRVFPPRIRCQRPVCLPAKARRAQDGTGRTSGSRLRSRLALKRGAPLERDSPLTHKTIRALAHPTAVCSLHSNWYRIAADRAVATRKAYATTPNWNTRSGISLEAVGAPGYGNIMGANKVHANAVAVARTATQPP